MRSTSTPAPPTEKFDGRDIRDGNFFWMQQELLTVFVPLIGADASWLYAVLCRLIPLTEKNGLFDLTYRVIAKSCGWVNSIPDKRTPAQMKESFNVAAVKRSLDTLTAIGMIEVRPNVIKNRAATYFLTDLRTLGSLGTEELKRRLRVSGGNTGEDAPSVKSSPESGAGEPKDGQEGPVELEECASEESEAANAPAGSQQDGVSGGNTEPVKPASAAETLEKDVAEAIGVSPERVGVSGEGGGVSPEGVGVSEEGVPLIKESNPIQSNAPLPPVPGAEAGLILPFANRRRGDPGFAHCLGIAARWVMARRGISNPRLEPTICGALMQRCEATGETLEQAAELAVKQGERYAEALGAGTLRFGPWGPAKFYGDGYWQDNDLWPWNEAVRATRAEAQKASVGQITVPAPMEALPPDALPEGLDASEGREIWLAVLEAAAKEINPQGFETWLKPLRSLGVRDGVLYVKVPNRAFDHAVERYAETLMKFLPAGVSAVRSLYLDEASRWAKDPPAERTTTRQNPAA